MRRFLESVKIPQTILGVFVLASAVICVPFSGYGSEVD